MSTPTAVQLTNATAGDLLDVPGLVTAIRVEPRPIQRRISKFFGVDGESIINGGSGGRDIVVQVLIYDTSVANIFSTARKLSDWLDYTAGTAALESYGTLDITSESDHSKFTGCVFNGLEVLEGPKPDLAGTLSGDYWADVLLMFRQLVNGAAEV